jgi:sarcosine oxidase
MAQSQAQPADSSAITGNFDIAIIGAGLFGAAAARHLSGKTDGVAVIGPAEPTRPETHHGVFASHYDASRLSRIVDPDLVWATLARRSIFRYREIEARSGVPFFREIGYMMVTPGGLGADWFDLPAMREVASDLGVDIENLDDAALKEHFPYLRYTPGSSAILQRQRAGYIDPRKLLEAQLAICRAQGASVLREEVTELRQIGSQVSIKTRSGSTLRANRVLLATGAYTNAVNLLPGRLDLRIRAAMIMLSEVDGDSRFSYPTTLYAKTDGAQDYWGLLMPPVSYPDGRTYIKTMDGFYGDAPLRGYESLGAWSRGNGHRDHHALLRRALQEVFPDLQIRSSRFHGCLISDTASHYPYIDMIGDRVGVVVGGNGKAAKSSDEIGRMAADMIGTGSWQSSVPQTLFAAHFA